MAEGASGGAGPMETILGDARGLADAVEALAEQIARGRRAGVPVLGLVGVRTRGEPIAERLAMRLAERLGVEVPVGVVDIALHRDDLGRGRRWPTLKGTDIPFEVDGAEVVLVDDVLYTGRTIRAALNAICDLGRPAVVRLAVVVDRGGRELPIRADYVGLTLPEGLTGRVKVRVAPIDPADGVVAEPEAPR